MRNLLCVTLRFLDPVPQFHGRRDDGAPEWPPSPLRLFQALVSAATVHWRDDKFQQHARPALQWLESIPASVVAPAIANRSCGYRMYVPNNSGDLMTAAWARGDTETSMAKFRVEKDVRPTNLRDEAVRFLFPLAGDRCPHFEVLQTAARSITHLGWGIDMVAGNAELLTESQATKLPGEVWRPVPDPTGTALRVPQPGTLDALLARHQHFLGRLEDGGFKPVPPLSAFRVVSYRRASDPVGRAFAAFSLLKVDASGNRAFDPLRRTRDVAGMVRHAVATAAADQGWAEERINVFIHGKTPDGARPSNGAVSPDRLQYLPLPTINPLRVDAIRRVLIAAPPHCSREIAWVRRGLAGSELTNDHGATAMLTILPGSDRVLRHYVDEARTWSTVTPVILPGYDDPDHLRRKLKAGRDAETQRRYLARLDARMEELLRKAFLQAGYSAELAADVELEWRTVGFLPGVELASRYLPPNNLNNAPRIHVRATFAKPIPGPVAIGSGRFRGFGLFCGT